MSINLQLNIFLINYLKKKKSEDREVLVQDEVLVEDCFVLRGHTTLLQSLAEVDVLMQRRLDLYCKTINSETKWREWQIYQGLRERRRGPHRHHHHSVLQLGEVHGSLPGAGCLRSGRAGRSQALLL